MRVNTLRNNTLVIGYKQETPKSITIGYPRSLVVQDRLKVQAVLSYWLSAHPICGNGSFEILWSDDFQNVTVVGDFSSGSFRGDLTHRDAIGVGEEGFDIGLARLLEEGHRPRTMRGTRVEVPGVKPLYIQLNHERITVEKIPGHVGQVEALRQEIHALSHKLQEIEGGMGYGVVVLGG